jgi:hypothetical protein
LSRRAAEAVALRNSAADGALGGAIEEVVLGAAPAGDDAVRPTAPGDPQHVGPFGDVVEGRKRIDVRQGIAARTWRSTLARIWRHKGLRSAEKRDTEA